MDVSCKEEKLLFPLKGSAQSALEAHKRDQTVFGGLAETHKDFGALHQLHLLVLAQVVLLGDLLPLGVVLVQVLEEAVILWGNCGEWREKC
jgi:hypothetical protein